MKSNIKISIAAGVAGLILSSVPGLFAADSAERATATRTKIEELRSETSKVRNQIVLTMEELSRMTKKDIALRPQFEKYKGELVKMEEQAKIARSRADSMREKGQEGFQAWEQDVQSIQNVSIRKDAQKRYDKRRKSYDRIIAAMTDAKAELVPFMSDLNDIRKLLDAELTQKTVNATKDTIKQAGWHGEHVRASLMGVEKELDRVAADFAKYQ